MIVQRITPNKIKLGVHIDNNRAYRFYSVSSDIVVWFQYMYQAETYYADDALFIDVNKSEVIPNSTYPETYKVVMEYGLDYAALNGAKYTYGDIMRYERNENINFLVLENNNDLYNKLVNKINIIRYLHVNENPKRFTLIRSDSQYQVLDIFNPIDHIQDRNTRPYHHRLINEIMRNRTNQTIIQGEAIQSQTTMDDTERITDSAPRETRNYRDLRASYHGGVVMGNTKYTANDETPTNTTRYFGWELETELSRDNLAEYTSRLNDLMNYGQLGKMIKFERDGSLYGAVSGGCEIISQPMTAKYMIENRDKFKDMMALINDLGGTSHDNGHCGLHFHVSRASLTEDAVNEIYFVVETFKKELIAFSRRTRFDYCAFRNYDNSIYNGWKYIDKDYFIRNKSTGHGCALNNANSNTLEFRFIRGTTNIQTFMASMELIDNICNMVMNGDMKNGTTWLDIINYNDGYEDLKRYNERRNITSTKEYNTILDLSRSDR